MTSVKKRTVKTVRKTVRQGAAAFSTPWLPTQAQSARRDKLAAKGSDSQPKRDAGTSKKAQKAWWGVGVAKGKPCIVHTLATQLC